MRPRRLMTLAAGLAAGLALAPSAWAEATATAPAETPSEELTAIFQCATAMGLYAGFMQDTGNALTESDRALSAGAMALEPRLRTRGEALATGLGEGPTREIISGIKTDLRGKIDALGDDPDAPRKVIDLYRPVLSACIVRGGALPDS